jgi:hypothetical protein
VADQVRAVLDAVPGAVGGGYQNAFPGAGARYREVLILREYHDLSYEEIARTLCTTRAAVKSILFRARQVFKDLWERRHGDPFCAEGAAS